VDDRPPYGRATRRRHSRLSGSPDVSASRNLDHRKHSPGAIHSAQCALTLRWTSSAIAASTSGPGFSRHEGTAIRTGLAIDGSPAHMTAD
jgi:hypothetical protein